MAISKDLETQILKIVAGLFNAAPGGTNLTELANLVEGGMSISQLSDALAANALFTKGIMAGKVTTDEQVAVLMDHFGVVADSDPASAGSQAEAYFTQQIENHAGFGKIVYDAVTFLASTTDTAFTAAATLLANKALVAAAYSRANSSSDLTTLQNVLSTVTGTAPYTDDDINAVLEGSGSTGQTYTLTTSIDVLTGTTGNDAFIGDAGTVSAADQINGGAGKDTLTVYTAASVDDIGATTAVENLALINSTAGFDTSSSSATAITFDNATTAQTYTVGSGVSSTIKNMANAESITITNSASATSGNLTFDAMGTTADVTVNYDGAALTAVNVAATGHASFVALASTGSIATVNVTGSQDLQLTLTGETTVTTLNASALTGGLTSDLGASASNTTVTTGSGDDTITAVAAVNYSITLGAGDDTLITADAAGETTTADTLAGGDGTDTLGIASAEAVGLDDDDVADNAVLAKITGFEQLRITDALGGDLAIDNLGYNYIQFANNAIAADRTITGFSSGATVEFRGANNAGNDYIIGMTGATGAGTNSDTLNVNLNADLTANDTSYTALLDLEGINIINVAANDRDTSTDPDTDSDGQEGYVIDLAGGTAGHSANISTVNISGAQQVSYTVNAATTALSTVNASTATGNIIVDASAFAGTQGITITTNSGIDTLTGSTLADIISAGAGDDDITGGTGADSLTGGDGADTFNFDETADFTAATAATLATNADVITDFTKASDILSLTGGANWSIVAGGSGGAGQAVLNAEGIATSFNAADDTLAERITAVESAIATGAAAAGQYAVFEFGSDSYVFVSEGTDGVGAGDMLVKLTGVTGLTDSTISTTDLIIG
ncbi:MAG: calcium-binding protein [Nitrosomonas oligotropha]|uniref:Calcium-binding protein n=1 Tax=Nitrosomonas oligotropha TaxID=42354 RepID=A0A5C7VVF9_9PROT|nr:MAG: calcium-binding protein [Nitrosomonas oligotropha]